MSNMRTIRVTGKGQIKVKPDMTRITMSLEGTYPEYGETLRKSSEDTESLKDLLAGFGFELYADKAKDRLFAFLLLAMMIPGVIGSETRVLLH